MVAGEKVEAACRRARLVSSLNRSILITGASSGLGAALAKDLASRGARLALCARRVDRLEELAHELETQGAKAEAITCDVADEFSLARAFDIAERALGSIDGVIANAGVSLPGSALEQEIDAFDRMISINVRGAFLTAREGARRMRSRGVSDGRIIFIASIAAHTPLKQLAGYCASKAGVAMLARALALEWAGDGVSVNAICPGYAPTEMNDSWFASEAGQRQLARFPRRRLVACEAITAMAAQLLAPEAAQITGSVITVDDGQSFRI